MDDTLDPLVSGEQLDAIESGQASPKGPVMFAGFVDSQLDTTFIDPRQVVEVRLRPGRSYSQVVDQAPPPNLQDVRQERQPDGRWSVHYLPGKTYKVSRQTYEANRATLCTAGEYNAIMANMGTARHQQVQREIDALRDHNIALAREKQPDKAQQEDRLRAEIAAQLTATERGMEQARRIVSEKEQQAQDARQQALRSELAGLTPEQFNQRQDKRRTQVEDVAKGLGSRAKDVLLSGHAEDEKEERKLYESLRPTQQASDPIARLRSLRDSGVITNDDFDRQVLAIVRS